MKQHQIRVNYRDLHNIFCAAAAYYKEYKDKLPEIFDNQDEQELKMALKLQRFTIETGANAYKIEDEE